MSRSTLPCTDGLPILLLVEPNQVQSRRAALLSQDRFCVTRTDSALDIFLLKEMVRFSIAVLSDEIGPLFLCSSAENIRWQWPLARIIILGQSPDSMNDALYDDAVPHSAGETALLAALDTIGAAPGRQPNGGPLPPPPGIPPPTLRSSEAVRS
jgi:hypothetical protein